MSEPPTPSTPPDRPGTAGGAEPGANIDLERFEHHTALPHTRISVAVDRLVRCIGSAVSWVWLALLGIIVLNVVMRYALGEGRIEFEEIQWHLYSIGFLIGLSYVLEADAHVRVDVLHERLSLRAQAWIELYGMVLLLLPFLALVLVYAVPFAFDALTSGERSQAPGGLPYRWVIKSVLFLGFALLAVSALSRLTRVCALLFGAPRAVPDPRQHAGSDTGREGA